MALEMDNQGAITLASNLINNKRARHIDIRYHAIRDWVQKKWVQIRWIPSEHNVADVMTKGLGSVLFYVHRRTLGVSSAHDTGNK